MNYLASGISLWQWKQAKTSLFWDSCIIKMERRESKRVSWEKSRWADNMLEHLGSHAMAFGATPISSEESWWYSPARWTLKVPRATGHSSLRSPDLQHGHLPTTPPLERKQGQENSWGWIWSWGQASNKLHLHHHHMKRTSRHKETEKRMRRKYTFLGKAG